MATGCYVQTGGEKLEKDEAIDLVLGNNQKINIVEALAEYAENKPGHGSHVIKINQTKEYEELSIDRTAEHVRHISRFRTDAISSVRTVSFPMQEAVSEAEILKVC